VIPFYHGAYYFHRLPPARRLYLVYEDWACHRHHGNLASNYIIQARR
jgi:hypothetical protein